MKINPVSYNDQYNTNLLTRLSNNKRETKALNFAGSIIGDTFETFPAATDKIFFNDNYDFGDLDYTQTTDKTLLAVDDKDIDYLLSEIEAKLESEKSAIETTANSKKGLGALWNGIKGIAGFGTKGELKDIEKLQKELDELKTNPSDEAVQELYSKVFGAEADINSIKEAAIVSESINNGSFTLSDGTQISKEDVINQLMAQAAGLKENFDETVNSQGIISKGLNWLNNNVMGLGTTQNMTNAQIDDYSALVEKLNSASSSEEFASIYKAATGEDLTQESIQGLFEGDSKVQNSNAAESVMDYEQTQKTAITAFSGVVIGIATAAAPFTGGASLAAGAAIGAGVNVGIKGLDAATRNNGEGVLSNLAHYAKEDMLKDALVGAVNGFSNSVGNKIGGKLAKGFAAKKLGTEAVETMSEKAIQKTLNTGTRVLTEFADGAADGTISNGAEYLIDCALGESKFNIKTLKDRAVLGGLMGGVMSTGMKEGTALLFAGGKALSKGIDADKAAGDVISGGTESSTKLFDTSETETLFKINDSEIKTNLEIEEPEIKAVETTEAEIKLISDDVEARTSAPDTNAAPKAEMSARAQELYSEIENLKDAREIFNKLDVLSKEGDFKGRLDIARIAADDDIMSVISKRFGSDYADAIKWAAEGYGGNKVLQVQAEGMLTRQNGRAAASIESIKRMHDYSNLANTKVNVGGKVCTVSVEDISPNKGADGIFAERISLKGEDGTIATFTREFDSEGRILNIRNSAGGEINYRYDCYEFDADIEDDLPLTMFTSDGGKTYYAITNGKNPKIYFVNDIKADNRVTFDHSLEGKSAAGELKIIEGEDALTGKDIPKGLTSPEIKRIDDVLYALGDKKTGLSKVKNNTVICIVTDNDGNIISLTRNSGKVQNTGMQDVLRYIFPPDQNIYSFECAEMGSLANMIEQFGVSDFSGYRVYSIFKNGNWKVDPNCSACSQTLKLFGFIDGNGELSANDQCELVDASKIIERIKHARMFNIAA